jgi:S-adenosyl methyltransferase
VDELPDWVTEPVEVTVPNAARIYDYLLGGYHNFAVDRQFVDRMESLVPGAIAHGHANRAFVGRSVRWLVARGVRQFLDIGSGIPTLGNVHEVAQAAAPDARVSYVDVDPVAVAHSRAILAGNPLTSVVRADLRRPVDILYHPEVLRLLDFTRPVAVLFNAVLHFVPDSAEPATILAQFREAIAPGSYIVLTHGIGIAGWEAEAEVRDLYRNTPTTAYSRTRDQVRALLCGLELVEPGLVPVSEWRPDPDTAEEDPALGLLAAVGRKPMPDGHGQ